MISLTAICYLFVGILAYGNAVEGSVHPNQLDVKRFILDLYTIRYMMSYSEEVKREEGPG